MKFTLRFDRDKPFADVVPQGASCTSL